MLHIEKMNGAPGQPAKTAGMPHSLYQATTPALALELLPTKMEATIANAHVLIGEGTETAWATVLPLARVDCLCQCVHTPGKEQSLLNSVAPTPLWPQLCLSQ